MAQERITSVGFLRSVAQASGGLRTPRGQGLHRAAAQMIKMHEQLTIANHTIAHRFDGSETMLVESARRIYDIAREETIRASGGTQDPPTWEGLPDDDSRARFVRMAMAAHGMAVYEVPATDEEIAADAT